MANRVIEEILASVREGRIHSYGGPLSLRKTNKTRLKKWKKGWFRVAPGEYQTDECTQIVHYYNVYV